MAGVPPFELDDAIPLPSLRSFDETTEEYKAIDSLELNKSYTFPLSKLNLILSIKEHLRRKTEKRFIYRQVFHYPPTGRLFRVKDNTKFKTFNSKHVKPN